MSPFDDLFWENVKHKDRYNPPAPIFSVAMVTIKDNDVPGWDGKAFYVSNVGDETVGDRWGITNDFRRAYHFGYGCPLPWADMEEMEKALEVEVLFLTMMEYYPTMRLISEWPEYIVKNTITDESWGFHSFDEATSFMDDRDDADEGHYRIDDVRTTTEV